MDNKSSGSGLGLLSVLQIIFIVLKCVGVIDWSWWIVFTPLWIDLAIGVIVLFIFWILD